MANEQAKGGTGTTDNYIYHNTPSSYGNYQFIELDDIINNFTATYIGEGKLLSNTLSGDVVYHAHRALQELSYDTLKSCKAIELTLPPSLTMIVPPDYINYTKITWSDGNGIEHIIYPTSKTSNPSSIQQDPDGNYLYSGGSGSQLTQSAFPMAVEEIGVGTDGAVGTEFQIHAKNVYGYEGDGSDASDYDLTYIRSNPLKVGMEIRSPAYFPRGTKVATVSSLDTDDPDFWTFTADKPSINIVAQPVDPATSVNVVFIDESSSTTVGKYRASGSTSTSVNTSSIDQNADIDNYFTNSGGRRGIDPQYAQENGSFYIDCKSGKIHFSSDLSGKTIILHYLSDNHGSPGKYRVHKFAEEAMYKWIAYGCASARIDIPEGAVQRLKMERFAETRKAKLRLSNIKIEEITQTMRGKSKFIKH